jgi:hypothetical protein
LVRRRLRAGGGARRAGADQRRERHEREPRHC